MKLGGPVFTQITTPEAWVESVRAFGYTAAYCPLQPSTDAGTIKAFAEAASKAGIIIAETGGWSNPMSPDPAIAAAAMDKTKKSLELAEKTGARCCVNISGSCGKKWDGPHPANLTDATFDKIVTVVRDIIDSVKPSRTFYTLETMPWMYPDSPDSYLRLIKAVDRKNFAVHFDPVNLICSPQRYFSNGELIRECFAKLGPYIKSCHAKDILLQEKLTVHLDEVRPGQGNLNYSVFLKELNKLDADVTLMLEHLPPVEEEYRQAAAHIRSIAGQEGIKL